MARDGHEVDAHLVHIDGDLADRLRSVRVEEDLFGPAELANLLNRLHDTNLVVDRHDTDERRLGAHRRLELRHVDKTITLDRQVRDREALVLQMPAAVKHALVLSLACDDVVLLSGALEEAGDALDAHVVALGGAAGEDDLLGVGADEVGNVLAGVLDALVCLPSVGVSARVGVTVQAGHIGQLGVDNTGIHGSSGLHVKVDWARSLVHDTGLLQDACGVSIMSSQRGESHSPALGLIMASAAMPVVGMVASRTLSPVWLR